MEPDIHNCIINVVLPRKDRVQQDILDVTSSDGVRLHAIS